MKHKFWIGEEVEATWGNKKLLGVITLINKRFIRVHYIKNYGFDYYKPEKVRQLTCEETGGPNHDDPIEYANHFIQRGNDKYGYKLRLYKIKSLW